MGTCSITNDLNGELAENDKKYKRNSNTKNCLII